MTTLIVIDGHQPGGRRSEEVAARFRAELGRLNISASEAARRCHKTQAWMARRTSGKTPFDVDDLDMVCDVLGMSYDFIATGIRAIDPNGGGAPRAALPMEPPVGIEPTSSAYKLFDVAGTTRKRTLRPVLPDEHAA